MAGVCLRPERVNLSLLSDTATGDNDSATAIQRTFVSDRFPSIHSDQRFIMMLHSVDSNATTPRPFFAVSEESLSLLRGSLQRFRKWQNAEDIRAGILPLPVPLTESAGITDIFPAGN